LVNIAADLLTPSRWATISAECTTFVAALKTVHLLAPASAPAPVLECWSVALAATREVAARATEN
jgi:hypothetical protein